MKRQPAAWEWVPRPGITTAAEMREWQEDRCAVCGVSGQVLDLDHDHLTGVVRGWLCRPCNLVEPRFYGAFDGYRLRPPALMLGVCLTYVWACAHVYEPEPAYVVARPVGHILRTLRANPAADILVCPLAQELRWGATKLDTWLGRLESAGWVERFTPAAGAARRFRLTAGGVLAVTSGDVQSVVASLAVCRPSAALPPPVPRRSRPVVHLDGDDVCENDILAGVLDG